jgi:hypothetical protein
VLGNEALRKIFRLKRKLKENYYKSRNVQFVLQLTFLQRLNEEGRNKRDMFRLWGNAICIQFWFETVN